MKTQNRSVELKSLLLGSLMGACAMLGLGAVTSGGNSAAWEYKVVVGRNGMNGFDLQESINKAAADGWALVSTSSYSEGMPLAVLKKEKK